MPLQIIRQDITQMQVDCIVNTTNEEMVGYSGVDFAIHSAAGPELDAECQKIAPLGLGEAKITKGYQLPCKYVIHTSGPVWQGGLHGERILLRSCYLEALQLAVRYGCESVAFPLISAGIYGYPKDQVLRFAVQTITEFLNEHELMVYLCVFDRESYTFSQTLFEDIQSFIGDDDEDEDEYLGDAVPGDEMFDMAADDKRSGIRYSLAHVAASCVEEPHSAFARRLDEYLKQMDRNFAQMLFDLIDERGMTDVECYKKANVDRRTFSKIKSNKNYHPSKQTVVAFAISLQLDMDQTQELLATVGLTLSKSNVFDQIIRYFIHNKNYDISEINQALFEFDQVLLGSC